MIDLDNFKVINDLHRHAAGAPTHPVNSEMFNPSVEHRLHRVLADMPFGRTS